MSTVSVMSSLLTEDCSRFLPPQHWTLGRRLFVWLILTETNYTWKKRSILKNLIHTQADRQDCHYVLLLVNNFVFFQSISPPTELVLSDVLLNQFWIASHTEYLRDSSLSLGVFSLRYLLRHSRLVYSLLNSRPQPERNRSRFQTDAKTFLSFCESRSPPPKSLSLYRVGHG